MSDSTNKDKTTEIPEVSGLGSVKVDGKTVYESGEPDVVFVSPFKNEAGAEAAAAAEKIADSVKQTVEEVAEAAKKAHYPKDGSSSSPWAHLNKWGIWCGIILITLGTLIFLDMLSGVVPALENVFGGHSFWRFWPLLIVFGGIALAFSPAADSPDPKRNGKMSVNRFAEGMFTMSIGIVLLGCSLGYVTWRMWPALISYWPLLLVIAGLAMLSHGFKTEWFSVLAYVLAIVILLAVAASMWIGATPLAEPFASLAELGSYRGMDLFNVGTEFERGLYQLR